jgi:NAD(P)-dependent dehydrogenase (short-subunit alcohol dehydrogenase family)
VNAVSPGFTDTPIFTKTNLAPEEIAGFKETLKPGIPLARLGEPEEVAQVIVAQLESTYVTGAVWVVDGGVSVM